MTENLLPAPPGRAAAHPRIALINFAAHVAIMGLTMVVRKHLAGSSCTASDMPGTRFRFEVPMTALVVFVRFRFFRATLDDHRANQRVEWLLVAAAATAPCAVATAV